MPSAVIWGSTGSEHGVGRHGALDAGDAERHHHERRACALRRGPRPLFLFGVWPRCIRAFTRLRWRLLVQALLAIGLLLLGGSFRQFFSLAIFAEWLFYMIAGSTVFVFRRREPQAARPYRVWGYPVVPVLFVLASAAAALLHLHRQSAKFRAGLPGDSGWDPGVLCICPAARRVNPSSSRFVIGYFGHLRLGLCTADTLRDAPVRPRIRSVAMRRALRLPPCESGYPHCRKGLGESTWSSPQSIACWHFFLIPTLP